MRQAIFVVALLSLSNMLHAATILPNAVGLQITSFPSTITGTTFTDARGSTITLGQSFFVSNGFWFGDGDITVSLASPVNAAGFTFLNLCSTCFPPIIPNMTLVDSVTFSNGDLYDSPIGISAGSAAPLTQFAGVSSTSGFTTVIFHIDPLTSFAIGDFRLGNLAQAVPEPVTVELMVPVLVVILGGLRLRKRRSDQRH
jgi:hypothetical protein